MLCIFPVFSLVANAEAVEIPGYNLIQQNRIDVTSADGSIIQQDLGLFTFIPHNGSAEFLEKELTNTFTQGQLRNSKHYTTFVIKLQDPENPTDIPVMLNANTQYTVTLRNIYHSLLVLHERTYHYVRNAEISTILMSCEDGNMRLVEDFEIKKTTGFPYVDVIINIKPDYNVDALSISLASDIGSSLPSSFWDLPAGNPTITSYYGEYGGDDEYIFSLEIESDETGLLKSLLEWIKSIKQKIDDTYNSIIGGFTDIWDKLHEGFDNVVASVIQLPTKLWTKISDGLKSLFVPTDEQFEQISSEWDIIASSRFGALYEIPEIIQTIINYYTTASINTSETGCIDIPAVSLSNVGIPFTFGGQSVPLVPEGFETIVTIVKRVISIVCTFSFINAIRKRWESIIGG